MLPTQSTHINLIALPGVFAIFPFIDAYLHLQKPFPEFLQHLKALINRQLVSLDSLTVKLVEYPAVVALQFNRPAIDIHDLSFFIFHNLLLNQYTNHKSLTSYALPFVHDGFVS
jgi:hypothetical protein